MTTSKRLLKGCVGLGLLLLAAECGWAADVFVAPLGRHEAPYAGWDTAATNVRDAVIVANASNNASTVWVSNGLYLAANMITISNAVVRGFGGDRTTVVIDGGGSVRPFYLNHAGAALRDLTVSNGLAADAALSGNGGGVYLNVTGSLLSNCVVTACTATNTGGGVCQTKGMVLTCLIANNAAQGSGAGSAGGIAVASDMYVSDCVVSNNTALGGNSTVGGVSLATRSSLRNSDIVGNLGIGGGGVYSRYGDLITHCTIRDNIGSNALTTASGVTAGGIAVTKDKQIIRNCLIVGNIAYSGYRGGGGVSSGMTPLLMESCTLVSNAFKEIVGSAVGTGGFYDGSTTICWTNCIVYHNSTESGAAFDSFWFVTKDNTNRLFNCCVERPQYALPVSNGNITNDPLFEAVAEGDCRLTANSPCINTGTNLAWMADALDLDGNPRLDRRFKQADMGCYERIFLTSGGTLLSFQ